MVKSKILSSTLNSTILEKKQQECCGGFCLLAEVQTRKRYVQEKKFYFIFIILKALCQEISKICFLEITYRFLHYFLPQFSWCFSEWKIERSIPKNVCSQKWEAIYFDSIVECNLLSIMMLLSRAPNYKSFSKFS